MLVVVAICALTLGACAATRSYEAATPGGQAPMVSRVILLQPNIQLSELSAAGVSTPKAAWTETAEMHINAALDAALAEHQVGLVRYRRPDASDPAIDEYVQLEKLHEAVGWSIIAHKYTQPDLLPTKKGVFDWSLGPEVGLIAQDSDADHALFIYLRDSFSSSGRRALQFFAAAFGVGVSGGVQTGFASLVDLRTGDVVWFNTMGSVHGDLRQPDSARVAIDALLTDAPL